MTINQSDFGKTKDGVAVEQYTLTDNGISVDIITYGAAIRAIRLQVHGETRDVALGFDDIAGYESNKTFQGAVIGRVSNRIGNAEYTMNGKKYKLDVNDGPNSLHGGFIGFDKQVWEATVESNALILKLTDKEGTASGYPGDLTATVKYTLAGGELGIEYTATCTKDTPINMTNHTYFNLKGHNAGDISDHKIQIFSHKITAIDDTLIPTGELYDIKGTPFDLRELVDIGSGLEKSCKMMDIAGGYDHNWVLSNDYYRALAPAAVLECGGLSMLTLTTKPGIQFYSGNFMTGEAGKNGAVYAPRTGLCLETQYWPDSINKQSFPAPILRKGETYNHKTVYKFREV